jgi:hypothetical protein
MQPAFGRASIVACRAGTSVWSPERGGANIGHAPLPVSTFV